MRNRAGYILAQLDYWHCDLRKKVLGTSIDNFIYFLFIKLTGICRDLSQIVRHIAARFLDVIHNISFVHHIPLTK